MDRSVTRFSRLGLSLIAIAFVSAWYGGATALTDRGKQRPNIVVIMTDDQDDIGSISTMESVKRLMVKQGVRFTNSFVDFSLCCPSRASFLTGQSAHNH